MEDLDVVINPKKQTIEINPSASIPATRSAPMRTGGRISGTTTTRRTRLRESAVSTTDAYAELEIDLHRAPAGGHQVELRFTDLDSEADLPPERGTAALELAALPDPDALFHAENVRRLYDHARATTAGRSLRLRLVLPADAPELHALDWERTPLVTVENVLFSRFVRSRDSWSSTPVPAPGVPLRRPWHRGWPLAEAGVAAMA
ncbi:MAG: hypothetical protein GY842_19150 [bacterium]|nr:hypothetical protein [bacterium]